MRAAVGAHIAQQVLRACWALNSALEAAGDEACAARGFAAPATPPAQEVQQLRRGLGAAMGSALTASGARDVQTTVEEAGAVSRHLTQREVSQAYLEASGSTLEAAPSSVDHAESGDGLWLRGEAGVGQLVALYV